MQEERALATRSGGDIMEAVITKGDLSKLTPEERTRYYVETCRSLGLNSLTKPFEYIELDGKLTLYARRDATDQLRAIHHIDIRIVAREKMDDVYIVTARATMPDGRADESTGVVSLAKEDGEWTTAQNGKRYFKGNGKMIPLRGDAMANALMKAETKAKRRATLSIVGLGWMDESETETVPTAKPVNVDVETGEIIEPQRPAEPGLHCTNPECKSPGRLIRAVTTSAGVLTAQDVATKTEAKYGVPLCMACAKEHEAAKKANGYDQ